MRACSFVIALAWAVAAGAQPPPDQPRWFKGNTHTHTTPPGMIGCCGSTRRITSSGLR